jgi:hypothetical protein
MADQKLSLHTQVFVALIPGQDAVPVDIIATSAAELRQVVAELTGTAAAPAPEVATPTPTPAPEPATPTPTPTPTPGPSATGSAPPAPSGADTAQPTAATPSATPTAEPSSQAPATAPAVTLPDVLTPARELLQRPGGEETLRSILAQHGAQSLSTADPGHYAALKGAIEQALGA